jgi:hypothetical protein
LSIERTAVDRDSDGEFADVHLTPAAMVDHDPVVSRVDP